MRYCLSLHTSDPWMIGHLHLGSRPSDLCTVWYRTRWYLCDFLVVRILSLLYYSYPLVARAQGVEPCDLPGVFLGFQL